MKNLVIIITLASGLLLLGMSSMSCGTAKKDATAVTTQAAAKTKANKQRPQEGDRKGPPKFSELLSKMDANGDGKLSESEVDGRLKRDFSRIDKNNDGFLTEDEMTGPPQRGGRGGARN